MIVWSIIPVKDYIVLKYYGELAIVDITKSPTVTYRYKDRIEVDDNILRAYNWISNKLRKKIPKILGSNIRGGFGIDTIISKVKI